MIEKKAATEDGVSGMEIHGDNYDINYDSCTATLTCSGSLRLYGPTEYAPILDLVNRVVEQKPPTITLHVRDLKFLNSSGINTLSKFVIKVRDLERSGLVVKGSSAFAWQSKSLKNLQKLMPNLTLEWE